MERPLPEGVTSSVEAIESKHLVTEVHPLYDVEGNEIARSEIKIEVQPATEGFSERVLLKGWTLSTEDISLDMFEFLSVDLSNTEISIKDQEGSRFTCGSIIDDQNEKMHILTIPRPMDLTSVATIFHEFGHYAQNKEEAVFSQVTALIKELDLKWLAGEAPIFSPDLWSQVKDAFEKIIQIKVITKLPTQLPSSEQISELDALYKRYKELDKELGKLYCFEIESDPELLERFKFVNREIEGIRVAFRNLVNQYAFEHILKSPIIYLERDATKRAFVWMRSIKQKHGINLQSGKIGQLHLKDCLKTYTPKQKFREISES